MAEKENLIAWGHQVVALSQQVRYYLDRLPRQLLYRVVVAKRRDFAVAGFFL
jgi:hypothetical protein